MKRLILPTCLAALSIGVADTARAEGIRLDLTDSRSEWFKGPPRREHSGWAPEDPRAYPGLLVEFGAFGLIGENGRVDGRIRFGEDATLRVSPKPNGLLLRLNQKF